MLGKAWAIVLVLAASAWAGCIAANVGDELEAANLDAALPSAAGVPSYLHDVSEPLDGVTVLGSILEHVPIAAPDGLLLDTWIVRPDVEGPVPLVLTVTPYYEGGPLVIPELEQHYLGKLGETLVPRGYAVGVSSVRGTGNSEGCFTQGGPAEAKDTAAVIEHLASQPWSNGNVGLIGVSYPGTTPQDVWIEAPPALKTVVPIAGISDFYKYNFVNGVPINIQGFGFNTYYWVMVGNPGYNGAQGVLDPVGFAKSVATEPCAEQVDVQESGVSSTVDGNKDGYWQARDFVAELAADPAKERASVFYIHGLQDWNVKPHMMEDWLPALWESGVPMKVWLGQWGHAWPDREDWWEQVLVAWFDQFLKGVDTGILDMPAVQVKDDDDVWRHEHTWPPADVEWRTLYPHADGSLAADAPGEGEARYHDGAALELPQASQVVFRSEPFTEDSRISGLPLFEGTVTAEGQRASLMLTLAEELKDGTLRSFNYAALSLNHAESLASGKDDISGLAQEVSVQFFPQDDVVHAGSRLVLIAAGTLVMENGPGPSLQPVSDGGEIAIDLATAKLTLPIDLSIVVEEPQPKDA